MTDSAATRHDRAYAAGIRDTTPIPPSIVLRGLRERRATERIIVRIALAQLAAVALGFALGLWYGGMW